MADSLESVEKVANRMGFRLGWEHRDWRLWIKGNRNVYEHTNGKFNTSINQTWVDGIYTSFEEAAGAT